jgi:hypothetical protein
LIKFSEIFKGTFCEKKPKVPQDQVFKELKSIIECLFDSKGNLIPYSDKLWIQISENLDRKISPHNLYCIVSQNRYSWKTDLKSLLPKLQINNANSPEL